MKKFLIFCFVFFLLGVSVLAGIYFYLNSKMKNPEWAQGALKTFSVSFFNKMCRKEITRRYARNKESISFEKLENDMNVCGCFSERSAENFSRIFSGRKISLLELIQSLADEKTKTELRAAVSEARAFCRR